MGYDPRSTDWTRPLYGAFAVTPGASALPQLTRAIYVGVSGDVTVTMESGESVEMVGLAAGIWHPVSATHVTAATATDILGGY